MFNDENKRFRKRLLSSDALELNKDLRVKKDYGKYPPRSPPASKAGMPKDTAVPEESDIMAIYRHLEQTIKPEATQSHFLVRMKPGSGGLFQRQDITSDFANDSGLECEAFEEIPYMRVNFDNGSEMAMQEYISKRWDSFERIEEATSVFIPEFLAPQAYLDQLMEQHEIFLSASQGSFWWRDQINLQKAHRFTKGENMKVGIIDTGCDSNHKELAKNFGREKGYNFVNRNNNPMDGHGHGTHVTGIAKYCAPSTRFYAIKVLSDSGRGTTADVIAGIEWCIKNKMDIINLSLGSPMPSRAMQEMIFAATKNGVVVFASAGNSGGRSSNYPGHCEDVIAIPALNRSNKRARFSTINRMNDLSIYGEEIYSTWPGNTFRYASGTSMSSPMAAGVGALVKALYKNDPAGIEKHMKKVAVPLGPVDEYGAGLVLADRAVARRAA